jgi:orotate phosphoribosyltransferase
VFAHLEIKTQEAHYRMAENQPDRAASRARLIEIIKARSFQEGPAFKLASGKTSQFYFNMKPTMLDSEGAYLVASLILDELDHTDVDLIGGLEMGAVPIASSVATLAHARRRKLPAFFVRKQAKDHGTRSLVEGLAKGEHMAGKKVVIVEDVTTTGGSALKAAEALKAEGAHIVRVITIVDRLDGAMQTFADAGFAFTALLTLEDFRS